MAKSKYESHVKPYIALVKSMRLDGHTEEQIFARLDVGHTAWNDYKNKYTELADALKISKDGLISQLEQTLFQKALEGNPTLLIFALKNLAPKRWADKHEVDAQVNASDFVDVLTKFANKVTQ